MLNIVSIAMTLLKHRDSIAKIVAVLPELKTIFAELNPPDQAPGSLQPPPPTTLTGYPVGSMEWLQESLNTLGAEPQLDVDGEYGPATNKAVSDYQKAHGLTVDGWAGPATISSIVEELAKQA
jgi:peptidoglycan hydrolase-like protein with peptidoglycan-binding domain